MLLVAIAVCVVLLLVIVGMNQSRRHWREMFRLEQIEKTALLLQQRGSVQMFGVDPPAYVAVDHQLERVSAAYQQHVIQEEP